MRFLDCSPNSKPGYVDEADLFYENPQMWLDENYSEDQTPSNILLFDVLFKVNKYLCNESMIAYLVMVYFFLEN